MDKKVVLITGASSGMGLETAFLLLEQGLVVYGGARRVEKMNAIKEKGGKVLALDVTDEESMKACVNEIIAKEGHLDILINNAGYGACGSIEDIPMEEVRRQYEVNVFGFGRMIQLVLPHMRKQNGGRIINISSMGGKLTTPFGGWYHSTKYAVESISDALRMEVKPFHIDVVVIEPGMIQTDWGVIAAKSIRENSGRGVYRRNADQAAKYYEKRYGNNRASLSDPKRIARITTKAVMVRRPKTRYLVGKNAKPFVFMKTILSDRFYQNITTMTMGLTD